MRDRHGAGNGDALRISTRLYRWLLRLYPAAFRRAYGEAMAGAFREALRGRRARLGAWGVPVHWARTLLDLAVNVPAEWALVLRGEDAVAGRRSGIRGTGGGGAGMTEVARYEILHALRGLRRAPGLALTIVVTLAVGIGVVTAFFGLVDALLLRPLPYSAPEELVRVQEQRRGMGMDRVSPEAFEALRTGARSLADLAMYESVRLNLTTDEWSDAVPGARVGPDLLPTLGVRPALGRLPGPAETSTGTETVVVLSHDLWTRRFAADPAVLGRTVTLEGRPARVVGVMPEGFAFPEFGEVWAPFTEPRSELLGEGEEVAAVARLARGVPVDVARAEVQSIGRALSDAGTIPPGAGLGIEEGLFRRSRGFGFLPWLFLGAAGAVLLVVCSNVASLLLARGARRRSEMAVRASLGATRGRLVARTLLEGTVLAAAGGGLGLLASRGILGVFLDRLGANLPLWFDPVLDHRVVGFTLLSAAGAVLLFGLPPALEGSRVDLAGSLANAGGGTSGSRRAHRLRSALIAAEVALAFLLVAGGGLMATSVAHLRSLDLGVDGDAVYEVGLSLSGTPADVPEARRAFVEDALSRLGGRAGIVSVAAEGSVAELAGEDGASRDSLWAAEVRAEGGAELPWREIRTQAVTPDYFRTVGLDVLRGRGVASTDVVGAPRVAVLSAALAATFWPGGDALGRVLQVGVGGGVPVRVVGVVEDRRTLRDGEPGSPGQRLGTLLLLYLPEGQATLSSPTLVVRPSPAGRDGLAADVRAVLRELDPAQAVTSVRTLNASTDALRGAFRTIAALMVAMAAAGAGLAVLGLWGVIAQAVAERTREIGIRTAVGGSAPRIVGRIMAGGLRVVVVGLAAGLVLALLLTRTLASILYAVDPRDPWILGATAALFTAVGLVATWLPARRAARVDPVRALRSE